MIQFTRLEAGHYVAYARDWNAADGAKPIDIVKKPNAINPQAVWHLYIGANLRGMFYTLRAAKIAAGQKH